MWRNGNALCVGWSSLRFDSRMVSFWIFEPHSKNHSKGAKIPQILLSVLNLECVKAVVEEKKPEQSSEAFCRCEDRFNLILTERAD